MYIYECELSYILIFWGFIYFSAIIITSTFSLNDSFANTWKSTSRIISIFHAFVIYSYSFSIILRYPEVIYYNETIDLQYPSLASEIQLVNTIMFGYLLFDSFILLIVGSSDSLIQTLSHHIIGGLSMLGFNIVKTVYWNSLYYQITEFSTIFLHLTWFSIKINSKFTTTLFGFLTWLSFFIIRILGGIWLLMNVYMHVNDAKLILSQIHYFGFIYANGFIVTLNFFWFWKLTASLLKHLKGEKIKAN